MSERSRLLVFAAVVATASVAAAGLGAVVGPIDIGSDHDDRNPLPVETVVPTPTTHTGH